MDPRPDPISVARRRIERSVRTVLSGSPALPTLGATADDPGLFGPRSAAWVVHSDAAGIVGGVRSLLLQTMHPLAMAGVADHSNYRHDPLGRLHRTAEFIRTTTFGSSDDAEAAIAAVRRIHRSVTGTAPDGRTYSAVDPHLLGWVHTTEVDSFLAAHRRYARTRLGHADADRYVAEMAVVGERLGVTDAPRSRTELAAALAAYRPELTVGRQARSAVRWLVAPPLPLAARPAYTVILGAAIGLLPRWARRSLWLPMAPGFDPLVVRPAATALLTTMRWALTPTRHGV